MSAPDFPGDSDVRREIQSILGYYELSMWDEALAEAAEAEARIGPRPDFDELRVAILQEAKRWEEMRAVAERCARRDPTRAGWFVAWAYALRREKSIAEARPVLELALSLHPKEALIPFNLACYAAQSGHLAEAKALLDKSLALDPGLREQALEDPDLAPLRGEGVSAKGKGRKGGLSAPLSKKTKGAKDSKAEAAPPEAGETESPGNPEGAGAASPLKASKSPGRKQELEPKPSPLAEALHAVTRQIVEGDSNTRAMALRALVESKAEALLVALLAIDEPGVAPLAMRGLWECWLNEAGTKARREIERGIARIDKADYAAAAEVFGKLIGAFPKWAEPVNKLATVYYLEKRYAESLALCRQVVRLKPDHFGAWQGMALCAVQLGDWAAALEAARQSLRLQPRNDSHRELVRSLEKKLAEE
ncbi:MAG TPA: tetratricopeptide repeat protein [Candidatus Methylacidiphilales bacterium]